MAPSVAAQMHAGPRRAASALACFVLNLNAQDIFLPQRLPARMYNEQMPPPPQPKPPPPHPPQPPQPPHPASPTQPPATTPMPPATATMTPATSTPPASRPTPPAPAPQPPGNETHQNATTKVDLRIHPVPLLGQDCQAVGGWPKFTDYEQLNSDNWGRYFEAVYGEVPDSGYPICLSDFWVVYPEELERANVTTPQATSQCPTDASENSTGELISANQGSGLSLPGTNAIFHPPMFGAIPDNTWVEVIHSAYPADEKFGAWFYYAKGSGIWYNIGKSAAFQDHGGAGEYYGVTTTDRNLVNEVMAQLCAAAGDDTIQFLNHVDPGTCNDCCQSAKNPVSWNIELVACAMTGAYACAAEPGDTTLKAGWMGKRDCDCVEDGHEEGNSAYLNCKGVPTR